MQVGILFFRKSYLTKKDIDIFLSLYPNLLNVSFSKKKNLLRKEVVIKSIVRKPTGLPVGASESIDIQLAELHEHILLFACHILQTILL